MKIIDAPIPDIKIIEPIVFGDERGFFMESFNEKQFNEAVGYDVRFVQDNHSRSSKGVLRGLHYQLPPHQQGKLVRVTSGEVFDVAVDIRQNSPSFGEWYGEILSSKNKKMLWIPEGFAHGFLVLSDSADFLYKTTDYWFKELERSILWNDEKLAIHWPDKNRITLSEKDTSAPILALAELP
ncbi:dTDP-4-dehydrorhamnose 3,5-epimerase [Paludibacterium paludis]|uniref:dTDP-4-dehydrorhamnose 3,5-epimerase n=1 Tax=Paludibacterium paludis TaxID=1225769 RepID=A0A918U814_9NEIS|nr:dTDP-4-dehydrorhamnose 3,5-epimerase [Paludibacterium paludis]GGY07277.1 dTDP-4-dehydrorhamnose 3,5-epimerase [Paludibacterium paludis]